MKVLVEIDSVSDRQDIESLLDFLRDHGSDPAYIVGAAVEYGNGTHLTVKYVVDQKLVELLSRCLIELPEETS